jgi:hypothetical protein
MGGREPIEEPAMSQRTSLLAVAVVSIAVLALGGIGVAPLPAQAAGDTGTFSPTRTAWGVPDLQGTWDFRTITPMERPAEYADKEFLTEAEAADLERRINERLDLDRRGDTAQRDVEGAYNDFWFDFGDRLVESRRTSLVIDPPDGKIPARTPEAEKRAAELRAVRERRAEGPEDLAPWVRCIIGFNSGPPMQPSAYNNIMRVVQTEHAVVIVNEMVHDARIIPLDGRPHLPDHIRRWTGDSRGRWEGDTLVVETTNFTTSTPFRGSGADLRLTERLSLVDAGTLHYQFTIDDPESFTQPWTVLVPMRRSADRIFEYACHEGNRGLYGILAGARAEERREAEAAETGAPQ